MHILKIGTASIALCALAGTSANALTTTQSVSFHYSGFDLQIYMLDFATFNVPGQILTSVHLSSNITDSFSYNGFQEYPYYDDDGNLEVNVGLETYLDNNVEDITYGAFWIGGDSIDSRGADWILVPGEDGPSVYFSGSFSKYVSLNWDNYDNIGLYQNSGPLSFLYWHNSAMTVLDQGHNGLSYFNTDHNLDADFTLTYESKAAVPEPASWALMISGFGLIGTALRQRRLRRIA